MPITWGIIFSTVVASLNTLVEGKKTTSKNITDYVGATQASLVQQMKSIKLALSKSDLAGCKALATALGQYCDSELFKNAVKIAASVFLKRQKKNTKFSEGENARLAGDTLRSLAYHYAVAKYIEWICGDNDGKIGAKNWVQAATKLSFASLPAMPALVPIATLAGDATKYEGKFISVEGEIKSVEISHLRQKAISNVTISDKEGKKVTLALPYIKLDSGGIVPGAYVKIAGVWHNNSKEANFKAALDVDRTELTTLSKTNWQAWIMLQLREVFEPVPHSINASYSAEPGKDGAINPIKYSVYYSNPQN